MKGKHLSPSKKKHCQYKQNPNGIFYLFSSGNRQAVCSSQCWSVAEGFIVKCFGNNIFTWTEIKTTMSSLKANFCCNYVLSRLRYTVEMAMLRAFKENLCLLSLAPQMQHVLSWRDTLHAQEALYERPELCVLLLQGSGWHSYFPWHRYKLYFSYSIQPQTLKISENRQQDIWIML